MPSLCAAVIGGECQALANPPVPHDPVENTAVLRIYRATACTRVGWLVFCARMARKQEGTDWRKFGAIGDAVLIVPALTRSIWHLVELAEKPEGPTRSIAIVDEVSNMASSIARGAYTVVVSVESPYAKAVAIGTMAAADVFTGGLQMAAAFIE